MSTVQSTYPSFLFIKSKRHSFVFDLIFYERLNPLRCIRIDDWASSNLGILIGTRLAVKRLRCILLKPAHPAVSTLCKLSNSVINTSFVYLVIAQTEWITFFYFYKLLRYRSGECLKLCVIFFEIFYMSDSSAHNWLQIFSKRARVWLIDDKLVYLWYWDFFSQIVTFDVKFNDFTWVLNWSIRNLNIIH